MSAPKIPTEPPERLSGAVADVWRETVDRAASFAPIVDAAMFEAYCTLIARWRSTAKQVADDGLVVGDEKKGAIVHPALAAERQLADQIKDWAPLFNRPPSARRKAGPMYDATKRSMKAAKLGDSKEFEGACEAVLTLAWLIDEAQRAGLEALQKASFVMIPSYLKGCAELQITPAALPESARKKAGSGGKISKFEDAAAARRQAG
jgi:phage terminase small subunit